MYENITYMSAKNRNKKGTSGYIIIIGLIVIALIISYFLIFKDLFKDKNIKMEEKLVNAARDYVLSNNIYTNKEIYLNVSKLNVVLDDECNLVSGVIYDGENYYPNLVCSNYKSNVIKRNIEASEYINLKGDDVIILARGMTFTDPGYISNDIVTVIGNVGSEDGVYNLYYKPTNSNVMANRKVIIIDNQTIGNLFPNISLNGNDLIYLIAGTPYQEAGASALDTYDGNITSKVMIEGNVDVNTVGEYLINYSVTNSKGYSNTITRKIIVTESKTDLIIDYKINPSNLTNENVLINLVINGEYQKIIYPDGSEGRSLTYEVSENGLYKFTIYDTSNHSYEKEIEISNISRELPQGTCIATRYYNKTEVIVNPTSGKTISSYEYYINGNLMQMSKSSIYVSNIVKPSKVSVKIKDSINNVNEINCSFTDKLTRNITTSPKGKNCLEGMVCYIQYDYGSNKYPFCSVNNNPNACGGIGQNGCSITSATNAIANMGIKSKNGTLYNPFTVWDELYPINKRTGECGGGCSGWSKIRAAIVNAGLSASRNEVALKKETMPTIIDNLKKGYPVVIYARGKPFSEGSAHYMTLLAVREDGYVFLSDSANTSGTKKSYYDGKQYYVDTWISPNDLLTGNVKEFLLVGPYGVYEGK